MQYIRHYFVMILCIWNMLQATLVLASDQSLEPVFMKASVSDMQPYVNSQIIYTVSVYYSQSINNASITPLQIDDATVLPINEGKTYLDSVSGKLYQVYERKYAVIPEKSGVFAIPSPFFTGEAIVNNEKGNTRKPLNLHVKPILLNVRSAIFSANKSAWLPAKKIDIRETFDVPFSKVKTGMPITRTIIMTGHGITAEQLPPVNKDIISNPNVKIYTVAQPQLNSFIENETVVGQRIEKIVYVPVSGNTLKLPAVSITWWNLATNQFETTNLPAHSISITSVVINQQNKAQAFENITSIPAVSNSASNTYQLTNSNTHHYLKFLAGFFILLGLMGVLHYRKKLLQAYRQILEKYEQNRLLKNIQRDLQLVCKLNDPAKIRKLILEWFSYREKNMFKNLTEITLYVSITRPLKEELQKLDKILYGHVISEWNSDNFWNAFVDFYEKKSRKHNASIHKNNEDQLPSLFEITQKY